MAAIYFIPSVGPNTIYANSFAVNNSVYIPFLQDFIGSQGSLIVTEVTVQHHDTIQYFLTFDDFISYYYFGKGLGHIAINGMIFSDCIGNFKSLTTLLNRLSSIRGTIQQISFGNVVFAGVMSSFTVRASSDVASIHALEFMLQIDVIASSMPPAIFAPTC